MEKCPECKETIFYPETHKCLPMWDVYDYEGNGDDPVKVRAFNAGAAAEKYVRWNDDERTLVDDSMEVEVQDGDKRRKFSVSASMSIDYDATEQE